MISIFFLVIIIIINYINLTLRYDISEAQLGSRTRASGRSAVFIKYADVFTLSPCIFGKLLAEIKKKEGN